MDSKELYLRCIKEKGISKEAYARLGPGQKSLLVLQGDGKYWLQEGERKKFKVVLTGGVFDILHMGHVLTLQKAKEYGDLLIVVVATDERVKKEKGREPIHNANYRAEMVSALRWVDLAVVGSSNPLDTFSLVKPDVVVFGYDQRPMELPNCKVVHLSAVRNDEELSKTSRIIRQLGL